MKPYPHIHSRYPSCFLFFFFVLSIALFVSVCLLGDLFSTTAALSSFFFWLSLLSSVSLLNEKYLFDGPVVPSGDGDGGSLATHPRALSLTQTHTHTHTLVLSLSRTPFVLCTPHRKNRTCLLAHIFLYLISLSWDSHIFIHPSHGHLLPLLNSWCSSVVLSFFLFLSFLCVLSSRAWNDPSP